MRRVRGYILVIFVLFIWGCAGMTPPVEVPQEVVAESIDTVNQSSSVVSNVFTGMDWKTLLLFTLLAGWAIPSPGQMLGWLAGPLSVLKWW